MTDPVPVSQHAGGWSLVQHGSWEVSIGPDGLIMLPRHLDPSEVADFIEAITAAAQVGSEKQEANASAEAAAPVVAPASTIVVAPAGDPAHEGAVPVQVVASGANTATPAVEEPVALVDAPLNEQVEPPAV